MKMISGVISYFIIFYIGLSLVGVFGDVSGRIVLYGIALVLILVWWVLRQLELIPHF